MQIKIDYTNKISKVLEELKHQQGISKTWVAKQMGISLQSLASLENSDNPTMKMLLKLGIVLKMDISDFYSYKATILYENDD